MKKNPLIKHLNRQIPPEAHTSMYVWHKFWARKTWNVVGAYIENYCPEGGTVFDPFGGSGVTAIEAVRRKRRAIICDLVPIATEITRLTIKPVSNVLLYESFKKVEQKVKSKIEGLYQTECRKCNKKIIFDTAIWKGAKCSDIRYQKCPFCGDRRDANCSATAFDENLLKSIESSKVQGWYPTNRLYYPDGQPFKEKQQFESVPELFTKRNLQALAWLMEAIEAEKSKSIRDYLKIAFSSMVHLCSRMNAISNPSSTSHHTSFSSTGWTQHSYWHATDFMEQNVWNKFDSAINGAQGLLKAKAESNPLFKHAKIASSLKKFVSGEGDVYIYTGSCFDLMKQMVDNSIDYIFTDPPYDASVQYGELSYMWVSWLKLDKKYLEKIVANEVIRNEHQHKDFDTYYAFLSRSFQQMFQVLKPKHYLTLTFHNPEFKVRNATIKAGVFSGFDFEKILYQPLGQVSAKSLLQPFGSAQGVKR
jgi:16S rRNA G966 N2-methylase RsmD